MKGSPWDPQGEVGASLPVNLILKWEWGLERKRFYRGMISEPLSLYLEEREMSTSQRKTNDKSQELGVIP